MKISITGGHIMSNDTKLYMMYTSAQWRFSTGVVGSTGSHTQKVNTKTICHVCHSILSSSARLSWTFTSQSSSHQSPCVYKQTETAMLVAAFSLPKASFLLIPRHRALCHFYLLFKFCFLFFLLNCFYFFLVSELSLLLSQLGKFTALISPETCITSRCVWPVVVLKTHGFGVKGRSD